MEYNNNITKGKKCLRHDSGIRSCCAELAVVEWPDSKHWLINFFYNLKIAQNSRSNHANAGAPSNVVDKITMKDHLNLVSVRGFKKLAQLLPSCLPLVRYSKLTDQSLVQQKP